MQVADMPGGKPNTFDMDRLMKTRFRKLPVTERFGYACPHCRSQTT
ncbi:hypothetical protein RSSM_05296 [Rhodopirellula sallentina SM41]|uniref:Uncharacterized protein n=1 Tax=Rhodopirellula sallentina SM41 TaxID=1263870 RepID=M5UBE7_9BACT|nr:hypothetical protein RSSM_05296 [Rhodopirellula sallentina SM41]